MKVKIYKFVRMPPGCTRTTEGTVRSKAVNVPAIVSSLDKDAYLQKVEQEEWWAKLLEKEPTLRAIYGNHMK